MNYALIENGIITNVIWLHPGNAAEFPNAVALNYIPAGIGDTYADGAFYRDSVKILTAQEKSEQEIQALNDTIAELDAALLDETYQNIMGGIGQ